MRRVTIRPGNGIETGDSQVYDRIDIEKLEGIHQKFRERNLVLVIGAGTSIAAGLPGWTQLNQSLLAEYFRQEFSFGGQSGSTSIGLAPEPEELRVLAKTFAEDFGQDAVVDLLYEELKGAEEEFYGHLRKALYPQNGEARLKPIHYEIAAFLSDIGKSRFVRLYTLNYDDLIERAVDKLTEYDSKPVFEGDRPLSPRSIVHLHGYFPRRYEEPKGEFILSEKDYLEASQDWADDRIQEVFRHQRDILFVGLSMRDPRLRRLLHERKRQGSGQQGEVFTLLTSEDEEFPDAPLERRAHKIAAKYQERYWKSWDVSAIHLPGHELLPYALRLIRLGMNPVAWAGRARDFLEEQQVYDKLYDSSRQAAASLYLREQLRFLRTRFEALSHEELSIGLFVPEPKERQPRHIQLAFRYAEGSFGYRHSRQIQRPEGYPFGSSSKNSDRIEVQVLLEDYAQQRRLEIANLETPQGAAGYCYVRGAVVNARRDSPQINRFFSSEMRKSWNHRRTFSSLLCVPVFDTSAWVPVGVVCLTSSLNSPFWAGLASNERLNLSRVLRSTFRNLLEYKSTVSPSESHHDKT